MTSPGANKVRIAKMTARIVSINTSVGAQGTSTRAYLENALDPISRTSLVVRSAEEFLLVVVASSLPYHSAPLNGLPVYQFLASYGSECFLCLRQFASYNVASCSDLRMMMFSALLSSAALVKLNDPVMVTIPSRIITLS